MQPITELLLWSLLLALLTALLYRFLVNQGEARRLKAEMKGLREKSSQAQKSGDSKEASRLMSEMLKANQGVFRMNMKPMLVSTVLFFIVLGWMGQFYGVSVDFSKNPNATFSYGGVQSKVFYAPGSDQEPMRAGIDMDSDGRFSDSEVFREGEVFEYKGVMWKVLPLTGGFIIPSTTGNAVYFEMVLGSLPFALPLIGTGLNWFWWYLIIVVAGNFLFRKLLGVE